MTQDPTPQQALEAIRSIRADLDRRLVYPLGSRVIHATLMAGVVAVFAAPAGVAFGLAVLIALGAIVVALRDRARLGWQAGVGLSRGAQAVGLGLGLAMMALIALAMSPRLFDGPVWAGPLAVALAWLAAFAAGEVWMRAYRRDVAG
ncbi:MAG: hypothetical protein K2X25_17705 [Caulobacteraceae bacterium]|nr:hypothetical protein [Caulobacteraceae bacterium]